MFFLEMSSFVGSVICIPFCSICINRQNNVNNELLRMHELKMSMQDTIVNADIIWKRVTTNGYEWRNICEKYNGLCSNTNGQPTDDNILIAKGKINKFLDDVVRHSKINDTLP